MRKIIAVSLLIFGSSGIVQAQSGDERFLTSDPQTPRFPGLRVDGPCGMNSRRKLPMIWCDVDRERALGPPVTTVFHDLVEAGYTPASISTTNSTEKSSDHRIVLAPPVFLEAPELALPYYICLVSVDFSDPETRSFNMCKRLR